jgi:acyl-CoA thioester hydrolase
VNPRRRRKPEGRYLEHSTRVRVRFKEVDSLRIVWHGNFLTYFEDARAAFGREYGIAYEDMIEAGLVAPIVHVSVDYLVPANFSDELVVTARLFERETSSVEFYYEVTRPSDGALCAVGETIQVFLDLDNNMVLTMPEFMSSFYERWKDKMVSTDG